MEEKLQSYNKFELNKEIKLIGKKLLESENLSDHFSDDVSSLDDPDDENYIPETPVTTGKKKRISSTQSITTEKSPKELKKGQKRKLSESTALPEEALQKKPKKTVLDRPHDSDSKEDDATEESKKMLMTVKRNWEGIPNYFPSSSKFDIYVPPSIGESCKENWLERVELRKIEISNKVKEIFGDKDAVILVPYSGRIRMSFPCPEHDCSFLSVDIKKHLMRKHKWSKEQSRLQTSYNHTMFDFVTRMKTYGLVKPCICFICYAVFDRIDSHIARKHYSRGTDKFIEMLKTFRRKTEKILFGKNSFPKDRKHNLKDKLKDVQNLQNEMSDNQVQNPSSQNQSSKPHPHSTHTQSKALSSHTSSSSYSSHSMSKAPSTSKAPSSHTSSSYSSHTISNPKHSHLTLPHHLIHLIVCQKHPRLQKHHHLTLPHLIHHILYQKPPQLQKHCHLILPYHPILNQEHLSHQKQNTRLKYQLCHHQSRKRYPYQKIKTKLALGESLLLLANLKGECF